jgi:hypothetical protein
MFEIDHTYFVALISNVPHNIKIHGASRKYISKMEYLVYYTICDQNFRYTHPLTYVWNSKWWFPICHNQTIKDDWFLKMLRKNFIIFQKIKQFNNFHLRAEEEETLFFWTFLKNRSSNIIMADRKPLLEHMIWVHGAKTVL